MGDDELLRGYERSASLLGSNGSWSRDVETCLTEMARRGGERWVAFLRRELDALHVRDQAEAPVANDLSDFVLLTALRRAEREPDPAVVELGPQSRLETSLPELPRFAVRVRNVDPPEAFSYSGFTYQRVRVEARSVEGHSLRRKPVTHASISWPFEEGPVRPGATSTDGGYQDWIEVDLGEQLELDEPGVYEVRLFYSLDDEIAFERDLRGFVCATSKPVTIRVRAAAK